MRICLKRASPLLLFCLLIGCTSNESSRAQKAARPRDASLSNTDPCAMRMHDISGALLFYYATHHELPKSVGELRHLGGFEDVEYVCPVSGLPYVYVPAGLPAPNEPGAKIILYDAAPSHQGMRWAITILEPQGSGPLVTKVIAVPESYFAPP